VKCTACHRAVADGTSICPHCDAILDASFLGDLPSRGEDDTPVPQSLPSRRQGPAPKVRRAPVEDLPVRPAQAPLPAVHPGAFEAGERGGPRAGVGALPNASVGIDEGLEAETQPAGGAPDDLYLELSRSWAAFRRLSFEDKLTAVSAVALALMSAMPWRTSLADGDELGLLGWGLLSLALAGMAGATIWARVAGKSRPLSGPQWPMATIASGGASALTSAIAILASFERTAQFGSQMTTAWPAFGAFGAVLCSGGVLLGGTLTLMRLRRG
jgi:hypothetical protein